MSDIVVSLTTIDEITTRDIVKIEKPTGLSDNLKVAKRGGSVAKGCKRPIRKRN